VRPSRPTPAEIASAEGRTVADVVGPGLRILFCGINPGLYSGAVGHHFARPGNRFWKALHGAGLTPRLLSPSEERALLDLGLGVTNLVGRSTATADRLLPDELRRGADRLATLVRRTEPRCVAVLGIGAYRTAFGRPQARPGRQAETIGRALLWVLPNPSGLNASYPLGALVAAFRALAQEVLPAGSRRRSAESGRDWRP
jgi:double-stranded uracil-DNA glycosylase